MKIFHQADGKCTFSTPLVEFRAVLEIFRNFVQFPPASIPMDGEPWNCLDHHQVHGADFIWSNRGFDATHCIARFSGYRPTPTAVRKGPINIVRVPKDDDVVLSSTQWSSTQWWVDTHTFDAFVVKCYYYCLVHDLSVFLWLAVYYT